VLSTPPLAEEDCPGGGVTTALDRFLLFLATTSFSFSVAAARFVTIVVVFVVAVAVVVIEL
jgi:hypothetical protein